MIVVTGVVLLFIMFVLYKVAGSTQESADNTTSEAFEEVAKARLAVFSIVVNHFQVGLLFLSFKMDFPKIALDFLGWLAIPFSFNFAQVCATCFCYYFFPSPPNSFGWHVAHPSMRLPQCA